VVVLDQGRPVGLVVDRMANVVTVEADAIEDAATIKSTVDTTLLTGMIKDSNGKSMVMILDAASVIGREFHDIAEIAGDRGKAAASVGEQSSTNAKDQAKTSEVVDEHQLVSFEVASQEYAFPIEEVEEIVQLPECITVVPKAPPHVLGIITLRNRLLPLVSLRKMFGLADAATTEANKVVVVSLRESGGASVGVVMDCIKEVLRVNGSSIDAMPSLLSQNHALDDIQSICRLDNGKRLVSILSAGRMFNAGEMAKLVDDNSAKAGTTVEKSGTASAGVSDDEEQFVVFRLMDEEYGVPIDSVQEIVRVPDELTRVPKTPDFIEGVINLRGSVLPVVDQRRRFGLPGIERTDHQRIMVFTIKGIRTGFIVDSVSEVMRISARFIDGAPKLSSEQQRLIRRVANLEEQKRMILLLDIDELLKIEELEALH
jgi:purine-binding chemotaxis protein CheW